jgi:protoporphyrinogen/coproporphyrinogen III oxidase
LKRIAIIGGGISGLAAAFALERAGREGAEVKYRLFESAARLGGVVLTERMEGCIVEAGPDSFISEKPWAAELCRQVGLADELVGSNDATRKTYILVKGRLLPIPDGLMFMVPTKLWSVLSSGMFSGHTKMRMARERFFPPHAGHGDESVAAFIGRHYGGEMVERLADPLLAGVYGGEASQLSVRAVLPRFVEMEAKYGSLGRGAMALRKNAAGKAGARPLFTTLKNGMQQMVEALAQTLNPVNLALNTAVQLLQRQDGGWLVSAGYKTDHFDAVVVATSARQAAPLLQTAGPELARELSLIPYSSSITVALGYGPEVRAALPPGFGFLVPRTESKRLLAATFVHNKFPHRAPEDRALVRCFLGGTGDEQILSAPDEEVISIVRTELEQILKVSAAPDFVKIHRWRKAMAQYNVGHLERLARIESLQLPGVFLAGNGYRGIGVPDCVRSGQEAAELALAAVGAATGTAAKVG